MTDPCRRRLLAGAAALALVAGRLGLAQAPAAPARFSAIEVDVTVLRAKGVGAYADFLRTALLAELQRAFADRVGGPGPKLVVRVTGISLNPYAGPGGSPGGRGSGGGGGNTDYVEGEAFVLGARGETLARFPQLSAVPASSGGAWYDPASEQRRTAFIANHYAQWLRRTVVGSG